MTGEAVARIALALGVGLLAVVLCMFERLRRGRT